MKDNRLALRQLDSQLLPLRKQSGFNKPVHGWARTIRKTIGMTIKQLAQRLQVDPSRIVKIETAEKEGAVTIKTLENLAAQLNCRFVYAFVPNDSLEEMIEKKAEQLAKQHILRTTHTMALEAQSINVQYEADQLETLKQDLLERSWKHLWEK